MNIRYVCDTQNPIFRDWIKEKQRFDKKHKLVAEDLQAQADRLNKEKDAMWDDLWTKLQEQGVIPAHLRRDDFGMTFNAETGQLFITPTGHRGGSGGFMMELPQHLVEAMTGNGGGQQAKPEGGVH